MCKKLKEDNKERSKRGEKPLSSQHCHCYMWNPEDELVASVTGGQAWQRVAEDEKTRNERRKVEDTVRSLARDKDKAVYREDLKKELAAMRRHL